jgi:hypothetical protein
MGMENYYCLKFKEIKKSYNTLNVETQCVDTSLFHMEVSILLCLWARQLHLTENLHLPGHPVIVLVLRDMIKLTPCTNVEGFGSTVMTHMESMLKRMYRW